MAELTRQNQELRMEINMRRQTQEEREGRQTDSHGGRENTEVGIKFPTEHGVGQVQGDQLAARECYLAMLAMDEQVQAMNIEEKRVVAEPTEALEDIPLDENNPERWTRVGADLEEKIKTDLVQFLKNNIDVFAWSHDDMPGYNQIRMDEADQEKTSFVTSQGLFCYKVMPFGLKNAGATYQRLVNHMFRPQIGRNVEVFVDDMLVLKKAFEWTDECQRAFEDLKVYLTRAPLLSPSVEGEELYLYLAVTPYAVSSALIREEDKVQRPVYYTSKALKGAEGRYPQMEKLAFALITASRKLRHYFQAHVINVMTDHPLKKAMNRLEAAGRLIQWAVELSEFDIRYQPRHAIKAQALADFIAEFTPSHNEAEESERWIVHVDGSSTRHAGGIGVVLQSPEGDKLKHKVRLQYQATNNEVEYEALLKGLELAKSVEAKSIRVMGDSQLIMGQVNGMYEAREGRMKKYLSRVMRLVKRFEKADFVQIPREENVEADTIAKEASADESLEKSDEVQYMPSIDAQEVQQVDDRESWMTPIISYLKDGRLPEEKDEARKVRVRSARYVLMNEVLYKRGFSQPYLRCLAPDEANYVLREVHEGACGNHSGARSLVHKVVRAGYYWPNMQADAKAYVKVCDQCQRFSNVPRQPSEYLTPMVAPWPFAQWGLDILGPFPLGVRQMKFLVVGIDYFTKWVEAEPLAHITQQNVKNFVWKNIVCRFGVPKDHCEDPYRGDPFQVGLWKRCSHTCRSAYG
ncbi:uncharacterized protein LOC126703927 [Quercus robur]|uniref:uncharacterized protein LOC126703927 n=1 Tax=Quercus robur TaxID=38942 RepID=UPI002161B58F|nr:uncharacterized protein LOC126703927 [Quercus robur]